MIASILTTYTTTSQPLPALLPADQNATIDEILQHHQQHDGIGHPRPGTSSSTQRHPKLDRAGVGEAPGATEARKVLRSASSGRSVRGGVMGGSSADEFPLLSALGLYAADIRGDGNCLFNALSDQLYGDQSSHATIRTRVIDYMRDHAEYYRQFIDVHPGGGIRRNPKRKNAGAYSSPASAAPPSEAEIDRVFDSHLLAMARGGTWGDNMEITAFSSAFEVDVKIYQRDFAYMVTGKSAAGEDGKRPVAHIAYHAWEHYSSIRNLDGPHTGMPTVQPRVLSPEEEARQRQRVAEAPHVLPWQIDYVSKSLPFLSDKITIKRALEAAKGDINRAVSNLLDAEENGSISSTQESSSIERDVDSEDDVHIGPNKKQDRRLSRATKAHQQRPRSLDTRHKLSNLSVYSGSQESIASLADSSASSLPECSQKSSTAPTSQDSTTKSRSSLLDDATSRSDSPVTRPTIRLKLHPPKPPDQLQQRVNGQVVTIEDDGDGQSSSRLVSNAAKDSTRDHQDIKKQAQKAARKERQQAVAAGVALRQHGLTETPPVETLKTLYI